MFFFNKFVSEIGHYFPNLIRDLSQKDGVKRTVDILGRFSGVKSIKEYRRVA